MAGNGKKVDAGMTTDELIRRLRDMANVEPPMFDELVLREAADRLEELDERVAIMQESMDASWGNSYG